MESRDEVEAAMPASPGQAAPIAQIERLGLVDALRGIALFGILLVNVAWFAQPFATEFISDRRDKLLHDAIAEFVVRLLAEGKFYAMFSLLFGFGMAIQMTRAAARGAAFVPLFLRRMAILMLIAAAHVILLWYGDILHAYAMLGCVLLLFRNCRPRTLVVWMVVLTAVPALLMTGLAGLGIFFQKLAADQGWPTTATSTTAPASGPVAASLPFEVEESPFASEEAWERSMQRAYDRELEAYQQGTFAEQLPIRLWNFVFGAGMLLLVYPTILTMFLLGLWMAQRGILHDPAAHLGWLRPAAIFGVGLGLPMNLLTAWLTVTGRDDDSGITWLIVLPLSYVAGPLLCVGYVASAALLWLTPRGRAILSLPAWAGRMALSNYLLHSIICTTIFYSYGFGLFGRVGNAGYLAFAIAIFAVQIPLSRWWLSRFRFGPMEWAWRTGTYGKPMPMRY